MKLDKKSTKALKEANDSLDRSINTIQSITKEIKDFIKETTKKKRGKKK